MAVNNQKFTTSPVVIIGAGISGICTAVDLITRNGSRDFVILEKSSSVGGTWHDNKYPGSCCDVWSVLYSFSFAQKPDWSREYPGQEEMLDYLIQVAEKYGLYRHIRFNTTVDEARWDDAAFKWRLRVHVSGDKDSQFLNSYEIKTDFLVSAVGQLNVPHEPEIADLHSFKGKMMHSARWDWSYDFKGKRVAVIGNGATAAQIVPEVAKDAAHLTVYQRTPNWIVPRNDRRVTSFEQALFAYVPPVRWAKRALQMDLREMFHGFVADPNSKISNFMRDESQKAMKSALANKPELWEKLVPNYAPGCKRILLTDDYYPTLARDNVDLETRGIARVTESGIETADGDSREFDLIVLATGFRTVEFMFPIQVFGAGGRSLADIWKGGARAYNGVTVEDLPNFAMLYGPNTNLGHNSIILMIEAQSRYLNCLIGEVLRARQHGQTLSLTPRVNVLDQYNKAIQAELRASSFGDPNCHSWYKTEDGQITNNWPGTVLRYQGDLAQVRWADYTVDGTGRNRLTGSTRLGQVSEGNVLGKFSFLLGAAGVVLAAGRYWQRM